MHRIVIPSQTTGLKRKKSGTDNDHHIHLTPEIQVLMNQLREISGWQKYVFYPIERKYSHLFKRLSMII